MIVIVIELTPTRGGEREGARSKIGLCSGISMVQVSSTFCQRISIWILCLDSPVFVHLTYHWPTGMRELLLLL